MVSLFSLIWVLSIALVISLCIIAYMNFVIIPKVKQNAVLDNILNRKSVRNYIKGKEVTDEQINKILQAGMAAPTARNTQPWEFIVVKDRKTLDKLAQRNPYGKMLFDASCAIVIAGNKNRAPENEFWNQDTSAAAQNMLLEIEALGLGAVWVGNYPKEERMQAAKEELSLPENIIAFNIISIGYPAGKDKPKNKWNKDYIHYEKY